MLLPVALAMTADDNTRVPLTTLGTLLKAGYSLELLGDDDDILSATAVAVLASTGSPSCAALCERARRTPRCLALTLTTTCPGTQGISQDEVDGENPH
jgi:hypothetical protein